MDWLYEIKDYLDGYLLSLMWIPRPWFDSSCVTDRRFNNNLRLDYLTAMLRGVLQPGHHLCFNFLIALTDFYKFKFMNETYGHICSHISGNVSFKNLLHKIVIGNYANIYKWTKELSIIFVERIIRCG